MAWLVVLAFAVFLKFVLPSLIPRQPDPLVEAQVANNGDITAAAQRVATRMILDDDGSVLALDFSGTGITDEGASQLAQLPKVKAIQIGLTRRVTDRTIQELRRVLPGCLIDRNIGWDNVRFEINLEKMRRARGQANADEK